MVIDYDGRILAQADPGPGEKIVVGPLDIGALRYERKRRVGHQPLAHMRSELYPLYRQTYLPPDQLSGREDHTVEHNQRRIEAVQRSLEAGHEDSSA